MKCFKCKEEIKKPDQNTMVLANKAYCSKCADEIVLKAKTIEIIAKPTKDVPEYPAIALSKDIKEIMQDNKIGEIDKEDHPYITDQFPQTD